MASNVIIHPYRGFGNGQMVYLHGRVLKDKNIDYSKKWGIFKNILHAYRRIESDEIPNARVRIQFKGQTWDVVSDHEGYYTLYTTFSYSPDLHQVNWLSFEVSLPDEEDAPSFICPVLWPSKDLRYGLVTDIDDTIMVTGTLGASWILVLRYTLLQNHFQRKPLPYASELLNKVVNQDDDSQKRLIFYLSNSPWNLYNYITGFLSSYAMPLGPVMLRDYGVQMLRKKKFEDKHKARSLDRIFTMYSDLSFILVGDAASDDAFHYLRMASKYPGRVQAIYIRVLKNGAIPNPIELAARDQPNVHFQTYTELREVEKDLIAKGWLIEAHAS